MIISNNTQPEGSVDKTRDILLIIKIIKRDRKQIAKFNLHHNGLGILNTMVSLKYETDNPEDCISLVTGVDLCELITIMKIWNLICALIFATLLIFKKRILKTNN